MFDIMHSQPHTGVPLRRGCLLVLLALFALLPGFSAAAQETLVAPLDPMKAAEQLAAHRKTVEEERAAVERTRQELKTLAAQMPARLEQLKVGELTDALVQQARVDADSARLQQEALQADRTNTERRIKDLTQAIKDLEAREQLLKNPAKDEKPGADRAQQLERTRQALAQQRADLELEKQHLENVLALIDLAAQRVSLTSQWQSRVEEIYRAQKEQSRQTAQEDLATRLQKEQQSFQEQASELRQRLEREGDSLSEVRRRLLETSIQIADTRAKLAQFDIRLSRMDNDLARLEALADKTEPQPKELQEALDQLSDLQNEIRTNNELFQRGLSLTEQRKRVIEERTGLQGADARAAAEEAKAIGELMADLNRRKEQIQAQLARAEKVQARLQEIYQASLSKDLLNRRTLPGSAEEWGQLLEGLFGSPKVILYQVQLSVQSALEAMLQGNALRWVGLLALELALFWLVMWARRGLARTIGRTGAEVDRASFFGNLALILLKLLRRNLFGAGFAAALLLALWVFQVPQPGLGIIATLVLLWLLIKAPINLAWLLLASPRLPAEKQRPQLYRQLVWTLFLGGLLTAMTILARLSSLPEPVSDVFDRVFMCYLLLVFWPMLKIRRFLLYLLAERYGGQVWFVSLRAISLLLPLALLGAALLGLAGYVNLAWAVAWHVVVFMVVLVGWLVVRGLLNDLAVLLKNFAVAHSGYGLLWTQEIITPLHKILGVALFFAAWMMLFRIFGWSGESAIVTTAWGILEQPLFTLGAAQISLWRIFVTVVTFLIVVWLGQWSRAVTYRWVFSRILDLGVRHSLSVFTQYAIVLIGVLIILRIVGLDLTTLTVFAGAVGVGIGFGMQTIANNFISGLLLLIERPLRSGDIVRIGTNEGEISRIGIRSLTMKTFDNMEVIIPNSEVITNSFTNWTHADNVIRTVMMVGASYDCDPHQVKAILERILNANKSVLRDPAPMVLLWEFGNSSVDFRIQYYTDVSKSNLLQVRSDLRFGIWDAFKKEGISIPYPQRDLYIKEWPEGRAMMPARAEEGLATASVFGTPVPVGHVSHGASGKPR